MLGIVALAAVIYLMLMRHDTGFNITYTELSVGLITVGLAGMAIVLAMDAIALERSTGTLSFLLDKSVAGMS